MRKFVVAVLLAVVLFAPQVVTAAAVDYFLKIDGIDGESTDDKHRNEIDILSFSWGMSQSCSREPDQLPAVQSISLLYSANKATPKLMLACATGQHIKEAKLTCRKAGEEQQEFMTIKFSDLLISSYQTGGSAGDVIPTDQISFCFEGIRITTYRYNPDGSLAEVVSEGFATVPGGTIPPPDDDPGTTVSDTLSISEPAPETLEVSVEVVGAYSP
jgi:type VI secretion system secreted protein Hcp